MCSLGENERLRDALKRIAREFERREPERAAGLLGERWMREPSNNPSETRKATNVSTPYHH
jgi:hypothetical protein